MRLEPAPSGTLQPLIDLSRGMRRATFAALLAALAAGSQAGTGSAAFAININLNGQQPQNVGICNSASQSQGANAQVRVVCSTQQFVTITPASVLPTEAQFEQYDEPRVFGPSTSPNLAVPTTTFAGLPVAAGMITAVRVFKVANSQGPLEMLVVF